MSAHPPPIPPDQRPKQGGGDLSKADVSGDSAGSSPGGNPPNGNLGEQGRAGNIKQNTTNKGLQQDR